MNFDVQIVHSVEEVGEDVWKLLSRDVPFTSYRWYRYGERAMVPDEPVYILLWRHGEPVARATFWRTSREILPLDGDGWRRPLQVIMRRWPLLICQAPLGSSAATTGLTLPKPPLRDAALETITEVAHCIGQESRVSFCVFSYLKAGETTWSGWPKRFMRYTTPGPGTRLAIVWDDFDGYLSHLRKKQRYNIKRNVRLAEEQGIEIKTHPKVTDVDAAMALHDGLNRRYKAPTEPWMRGALTHANMVDCAWLTAEVDGRMVGCELMLGDMGAWMVTGLGLDHSVKYAYFALGYADLRYAIDRGAHLLRWGSETYEVKERLGFRKESNNHDVFAGVGLFQKLGEWVLNSVG
jgi:predicted N-acyltransferase